MKAIDRFLDWTPTQEQMQVFDSAVAIGKVLAKGMLFAVAAWLLLPAAAHILFYLTY